MMVNLPCGCQSRKDIMTQGNWQFDAIAAVLIMGILIACYTVRVKS